MSDYLWHLYYFILYLQKYLLNIWIIYDRIKLKYEGSKSAAVTEGGSAYDDRGYALNAHVYAKVTTATGETSVGTGNFTGYNSKVIARTAFLANVKTYDHDCKVGFAK